MKIHHILSRLKPLLFGLVIGLTLALGLTAYASWSPPTELPPNCTAGNPGCDAPINVGSEEQRKAGSLVVEGEFSTLSNIAAVGSIAAGMDMTIDGSMLVGELASAPNPAQNYGRIYVNSSDRKLYYKDSTGIAYDLTATGGGAGEETLILLEDFNAPGSYDWVVPAGVTEIHVDVRGAGGEKGRDWCREDGDDPCATLTSGGEGGSGARVQSRFTVASPETLYINVGTKGVLENTGDDGGESSDIRSGGTALGNRIIVAGGGGGGGDAWSSNEGGIGGNGGLSGTDGGAAWLFPPRIVGEGASPLAGGSGGWEGGNGSLGLGGEGYPTSGGDGGDGMYGGGGGGASDSVPAYYGGGGGGSSYSSGDNTTYETGANAGNGRIIIYQVVSGGGGGVADNLGNHTATQDLNMSGKNIFGVEKLTVNGLVKIGNFTTAARPTCDAAAKGGFIFDTTADKPYICAGAGWKPLDSDNDEDKILTPLDPDDSVVNPVCTANNGGQCFINLNSKSALDTDLAAGNIKQGVNVFGVDGTLSGLLDRDLAAAGVLTNFTTTIYPCYATNQCANSGGQVILSDNNPSFRSIYDPRGIIEYATQSTSFSCFAYEGFMGACTPVTRSYTSGYTLSCSSGWERDIPWQNDIKGCPGGIGSSCQIIACVKDSGGF